MGQGITINLRLQNSGGQCLVLLFVVIFTYLLIWYVDFI